MWYATPYHTIYHTIPYHAMPCYTIPYHTTPTHIIPCHTIPSHFIPYHSYHPIIPYDTIATTLLWVFLLDKTFYNGLPVKVITHILHFQLYPDEVKIIKDGGFVTKDSDPMEGHTHKIEVGWHKKNDGFYIASCNGNMGNRTLAKKCFDKHEAMMTIRGDQ